MTDKTIYIDGSAYKFAGDFITGESVFALGSLDPANGGRTIILNDRSGRPLNERWEVYPLNRERAFQIFEGDRFDSYPQGCF